MSSKFIIIKYFVCNSSWECFCFDLIVVIIILIIAIKNNLIKRKKIIQHLNHCYQLDKKCIFIEYVNENKSSLH